MNRYLGGLAAALLLAACTASPEPPAGTPTPAPSNPPSPSASHTPDPVDARPSGVYLALIWDQQTSEYRADICSTVRKIGADKAAVGVGMAWQRDYADQRDLADVDWATVIDHDLPTYLTNACKRQ